MANMSYCRFQNTVSDLRDCADVLRDIADLEDIDSEDEQRAAKRLIRLCCEIAEGWGGEVD